MIELHWMSLDDAIIEAHFYSWTIRGSTCSEFRAVLAILGEKAWSAICDHRGMWFISLKDGEHIPFGLSQVFPHLEVANFGEMCFDAEQIFEKELDDE